MAQIETDQDKMQAARTQVLPKISSEPRTAARESAGATPARPERARDRIIADAKTAINGERELEYGDAAENFDRIAALWEVVFGHGVTVEQVALCMDLVKTARLVKNPTHRDSWVDKAGYSALGGELALSGLK